MFKRSLAFVLVFLFAGCTTPTFAPTESPVAGTFILDPGEIAFPAEWGIALEPSVFGEEDIYSLVNGQADAFFAYGFQKVQSIGLDYASRVSGYMWVWQLATSADAYGLFTSQRAGTPVEVGSDGDMDGGARVSFWQDRYYVQIVMREPVPEDALLELAGLVSDALPVGGTRPALLDHLPEDGLVKRSEIFFREEISIQDYIWLGGTNVLGLDQKTNGVLAHYERAGASMRLLLIEYPDQDAAETAAETLGQLDEGPRFSGRRGKLVAGVYIDPDLDGEPAEKLLAEALE